MSLLKVAAVFALVVAASARPDSAPAHEPAPRGYPPPPPPPTYAPPPPPTYAPPPPPTYAPPPPPTYAPPPPPTYGTHEPESKKPEYKFNWAVKDDYSKNDYGQTEARDGYNTEGSYYVLLPDGRVQKTTYKVHKDGGFMATIEFEGEIKHDHKSQSYSPPKHTYTPPPTTAYGHA